LACTKDLTTLSVAGRYNKPIQYGRESAHKSRAQGNHSSLGVYMYTIVPPRLCFATQQRIAVT
jgi:hypothetical protein